MLWVHPAIDIGTQSWNPTGQHHLPLECLCQIHPAEPGKQPWNVSRRAKVDTDPKWRMSMWHLQFHSFECVKRWSRIVPILPHLQGQSNQSGPCRWSNPLASSTLISPKDWHQWSLEHDRSQPLPSQFQCLRIWDPLPYMSMLPKLPKLLHETLHHISLIWMPSCCWTQSHYVPLKRLQPKGVVPSQCANALDHRSVWVLPQWNGPPKILQHFAAYHWCHCDSMVLVVRFCIFFHVAMLGWRSNCYILDVILVWYQLNYAKLYLTVVKNHRTLQVTSTQM